MTDEAKKKRDELADQYAQQATTENYERSKAIVDFCTGYNTGYAERDNEAQEFEASLCPEDVGFKEYIESLTKRETALVEALRPHCACGREHKVSEVFNKTITLVPVTEPCRVCQTLKELGL